MYSATIWLRGKTASYSCSRRLLAPMVGRCLHADGALYETPARAHCKCPAINAVSGKHPIGHMPDAFLSLGQFRLETCLTYSLTRKTLPFEGRKRTHRLSLR